MEKEYCLYPVTILLQHLNTYYVKMEVQFCHWVVCRPQCHHSSTLTDSLTEIIISLFICSLSSVIMLCQTLGNDMYHLHFSGYICYFCCLFSFFKLYVLDEFSGKHVTLFNYIFLSCFIFNFVLLPIFFYDKLKKCSTL